MDKSIQPLVDCSCSNSSTTVSDDHEILLNCQILVALDAILVDDPTMGDYRRLTTAIAEQLSHKLGWPCHIRITSSTIPNP